MFVKIACGKATNRPIHMIIRKYNEKDFDQLVELMNAFQGYLVSMDPLNRLIRAPEYGMHKMNELIGKLAKENGAMYVAEENGVVTGFVAGIIHLNSPAEQLETKTKRRGEVVELFVDEAFRGGGIGKMLMEEMEKYLKKQECDVISIEVFSPNTGARKFYEAMGYHERSVEMFKEIT